MSEKKFKRGPPEVRHHPRLTPTKSKATPNPKDAGGEQQKADEDTSKDDDEKLREGNDRVDEEAAGDPKAEAKTRDEGEALPSTPQPAPTATTVPFFTRLSPLFHPRAESSKAEKYNEEGEDDDSNKPTKPAAASDDGEKPAGDRGSGGGGGGGGPDDVSRKTELHQCLSLLPSTTDPVHTDDRHNCRKSGKRRRLPAEVFINTQDEIETLVPLPLSLGQDRKQSYVKHSFGLQSEDSFFLFYGKKDGKNFAIHSSEIDAGLGYVRELFRGHAKVTLTLKLQRPSSRREMLECSVPLNAAVLPEYPTGTEEPPMSDTDF